jgi:hypothetical protein
MLDVSQYQQIGSTAGADFYVTDSNILLIIPQAGFVENSQLAQQRSDFLNEYARKAGRKFGIVVVIANILTQDAETRRVYQTQVSNGLYYGLALVVDSALSRAIATFFIGLSKPSVPTQLFGTVEKCIEWFKTIRPV